MESTQVAPAATADVPGEVAELRRQLDAMKAERDGAIDRAAKRYQQMVLAQSESRNYLKAGRLEVAAKQALQVKFDNLVCLLGHRDSSIAELQTQLAAAKKGTECEVTTVFETCREQDRVEIAALKKQREEDQKKMVDLETKLRIARAINEQNEKRMQQQASQQLQQQQQQLKRKLDDAMLQGETIGDGTATGWRSPTAPPSASAPAVSTPDKRQRVGIPGNGMPEASSAAGSRPPSTPSLQQAQLQSMLQLSPSQRPLNIEQFAKVLNNQLRTQGMPTLSPLETARRFNLYTASSSPKGNTPAPSPRQNTTQNAGQTMSPVTIGRQMVQQAMQESLKRSSSSIHAPNTLPDAKRPKPNAIPPLPQGEKSQPAPANQAGNQAGNQAAMPRVKTSTQGYHMLKPIDEEKILESFPPFNKPHGSAPLSAGSMNALTQAAQKQIGRISQLQPMKPPMQMQNTMQQQQQQQKKSKAPSGNDMFKLYGNPASASQPQSFPTPTGNFDMFNLGYAPATKIPPPMASSAPAVPGSLESTTAAPPPAASQTADFFDIANMDLSYDVNNPDSFGIKSTEEPSRPAAPQAAMTGRVTRSRSRSAAPQQPPAPAFPSTTTTTTTTNPSIPLIPVCLSCHTNWWNSSCDAGASCANCAISGTRCERIRCLNWGAGTCIDAKCRRVHEGHAWPRDVERPKTLRRKGRKSESVLSPVERTVAGRG